jgi:hypothetical protein
MGKSHSRRFLAAFAGLGAAGALLLACSTAERELVPEEPSWRGEAAAHGGSTAADPAAQVGADMERPDEAQYLVSDGVIVTELPPEVLASVRAQLLSGGHEREADALAGLYDLGTGRVVDPGRARRVQAELHLDALTGEDVQVPLTPAEGVSR